MVIYLCAGLRGKSHKPYRRTLLIGKLHVKIQPENVILQFTALFASVTPGYRNLIVFKNKTLTTFVMLENNSKSKLNISEGGFYPFDLLSGYAPFRNSLVIDVHSPTLW